MYMHYNWRTKRTTRRVTYWQAIKASISQTCTTTLGAVMWAVITFTLIGAVTGSMAAGIYLALLAQ